jgi:hypothetical protein
MSKLTALAATLLLTASVTTTIAAPTVVFQTDFNGVLPTEISPGTATLTGVQGYAGLGPTGNQFGGNFLRSATGNTVTLQLNNLPSHNTISLAFLFAAIDSLDGTGTFPAGDFFKIVFDGATLFSESFANALPSQIQRARLVLHRQRLQPRRRPALFQLCTFRVFRNHRVLYLWSRHPGY